MRLLIVQPLLARYRVPVFRTLAERYEVTLLSDSRAGKQSGFDSCVPDWLNHREGRVTPVITERVFWQQGVVRAVCSRPDAVLIFANLRFLSFWAALVLCAALRIPLYSYGQGLYSRPSQTRERALAVRTVCALSKRYICYTESCRQSLLRAGCKSSKVVVAPNSVTLESVVRPDERSHIEDGILFVGRLRRQTGLEILIEAASRLRENRDGIRLHIVGDGDEGPTLRSYYSSCRWITWHGAIHEDGSIAEISRDCRVGCYPGDAGLSVVHFFGLSLPPIAHDAMHEHMGPEPSYIVDGENGFLFHKAGGAEALAQRLETIWSLGLDDMGKIVSGAFDTYLALSAPPLGTRLADILAEAKL
jgi:glycosyltransferase involved in cell wall biosynthesis